MRAWRMIRDLPHLDHVWGQRCREENPFKTRGMRHLLHLQYLFILLEENHISLHGTPTMNIFLWNGPKGWVRWWRWWNVAPEAGFRVPHLWGVGSKGAGGGEIIRVGVV